MNEAVIIIGKSILTNDIRINRLMAQSDSTKTTPFQRELDFGLPGSCHCDSPICKCTPDWIFFIAPFTLFTDYIALVTFNKSYN